ncbi:MAG TPA: M1 family aminopeptidase [Vicinamibacterales bacterium]|nr:M1 family aminopeptidase [Vicinamibacterales bacterium]
MGGGAAAAGTRRRASAGRAAVLLLAALLGPSAAQTQPAPPDGIAVLLERLEQALRSGSPEAYVSLVAPVADLDAARRFIAPVAQPGTTAVTLRERDRQPLVGALPGEGYQLLVEGFLERGSTGRIVTWQLDVRRGRGADAAWFIVGQRQISLVEGLYRLSLDTSRAFAARDLTITSIDLTLTLASGQVFVAETPAGPTALVLAGRGTMRFTPGPAAERGQVRLFAGAEVLETPFDLALVRLNPTELNERLSLNALRAGAPDPALARRARAFFEEHIGRSFALDLSDLSREVWSLIPGPGDFLAEVRTRRFGTLTYARSLSEAEDVTLFDRRRRRNIALYASPQKLETRGRFYDEDDLADYDVTAYDLDVSFDPSREWVEGRATIDLQIRARSATALTLKLAETLVVRSVASPEFGRLLVLRVIGQNSVILNLPEPLPAGRELRLTVAYGGRLTPQALEREALQVSREPQPPEPFQELLIPREPRYLYSNRSYWYPQAPVTDYATAALRVVVPAGLQCVASGELVESTPIDEAGARRTRYVFATRRPVRYLAVIISRFVGPDAAPGAGLRLAAISNPRQQARGRSLVGRAAEILRFYTRLLGEAPYPSLTLALTESELPGGHSPAYVAMLGHPSPLAPVTWRADPVSFDDVPDFFLAHEIAHQWWGQAVGWENYHEQWLSEGLAQYFAALYTREARGEEAFLDVLEQMRRTSLRYAAEGPIWLGYRLGHVRGESRVFRALVYNKSAMVLEMLRRLVGDGAFFDGLRRFYRENAFRKAGTDDLRRAMEAASGETLDRFFEGWIFGASIPQLRVRHGVVEDETPHLLLRIEQLQPDLFDLPVTVAIAYSDAPAQRFPVRVRDRLTELRLPLAGTLRNVQVNDDHAALVEVR